MNEKLREQLSALADGELDRREAGLLLARYRESTGLRDRWNSYHLIGEAIRRGLPQADARGLADRVRASLDAGAGSAPAAADVQRRHRMMRILRPLGAAAIAASVSVIAILLVRGQNPALNSATAPSEVVPVRTGAPTSNIDDRAVSGVRWDQGSPQVRRELNEYLFDHNKDAPSLGRQGMLPYVHIATFYGNQVPAEPAEKEKKPYPAQGNNGG